MRLGLKQEIIEVENNKGNDGKVLYKLMNNSIYRKKLKKVSNRTDIKLVNYEKVYLR